MLSKHPVVGETPDHKPPIELAQVWNQYGQDYCRSHQLPYSHRKVMGDISSCRTASLGGHVEKCDNQSCGFERIAYNSCRNRHCPKCQALTKQRWLDDRMAELLPVSYFHNVFTLPHELNGLILGNKKILFDILFDTVNQTLQTFANNPKSKLNGRLGFIGILHTWDQKINAHFHLHCLIPAGTLSKDKKGWTHSPNNFLFPVKALSQVFRAKFVHKLKQAYSNDCLCFPGKTAPLQNPKHFHQLIDSLFQKNWVVYSKKPFAGPEQVLNYLGRYTHRVAISNNRILSIDKNQISFVYKDRSDHNKDKILTLDPHEFIRRFLLHILPKGYTKIRHFGFLANRNKKQNIQTLKALFGLPHDPDQKLKQTPRDIMLRITGIDISLCPHCKKGKLTFFKKVEKTERKKYFDDSS